MLTACTGQEIVLAIMGVGAISGLWHAAQPEDSTSPSSDSSPASSPVKADFKIQSVIHYDGVNDDLLTAGVGQNALPEITFSAMDPTNPTPAEIRKATIINNYRSLQDLRTTSGYGSKYGPAVPTLFSTPSPEGKVSGREYLTYVDDGSGHQNITVMLQIPDDFDRTNPCLIAAPSPGSHGVYGAISSSGEWGLKNHCAVVYTDKGTGNGVHDLFTDTVNLIQGTRTAGQQANFRAQGTAKMDIAGYNSTYPYRIAQKHAHSQQNPEANWGQDVLTAIRFAFYVLNQEPTTPVLTPANTLVIAASIASGGTACLRAAELDGDNLIDGVVVAAPILTLRHSADMQEVIIQQGDKTFFNQVYQKTFFDAVTYYNVYQACASANTSMGKPGRCAALAKEGLLTTLTLSEQVVEAQRRLNDYGILETSNVIAHHYEAADFYASLATLYANAYGRFSVVENLCGYSYAASEGDGLPKPKTLMDLADDFQTSNGAPPTSGTHLIDNQGNEGKGINFRSEADNYLQGALCVRHLATGTTGVTRNTGNLLAGEEAEFYKRVQAGLKGVLSSGNLRGKPTIVVHGRDDALAPVNFTSRAYYALNQISKNPSLRYIEITHASHFDALNQLDTQVPLNYYFQQALDSLYDHLKQQVPLPKSQVVRTAPQASLEERLPKLERENTCLITFSNHTLTIPECN